MYSIAPSERQEEMQEHTAPPAPAWRRFLYSPLWLCLLVGIAVRLFLIFHGASTLPGDEALTGIQAENILRGLHPIYYYDQPYMGSLEAYILAVFFAVAGPSVFVLRIGMTCISLTLVVITWFFATALADQAQLKGPGRNIFIIVATLISALPPLYDVVLELRSWGGYIEAMIIMLWIMLAALRLTQHWQAQASRFELILRWLGLGFLVGFGLWINPLIIYAIVAAILWIGGFILVGLLRPLPRPQARRTLLLETLLAFFTIPSAVLGFTPGIIYGLKNNWTNVTYMFSNGSGQQSSIHQKLQLLNYYGHCTAARVIGGSLPTAPGGMFGYSGILTTGLVINGICIGLAVIAILLSYFWHRPLMVRARQLTLLPLIFMIVTTIIYCSSSIVARETFLKSCTDATGRYAAPLTIVLPFFLATLVTLLWQLPFQNIANTTTRTTQVSTDPIRQPNVTANKLHWPVKISLLLILLVYFATQFSAYATSYPPTVFKSGVCLKTLSDNTAIDQYMQQNNIHYAFSTGWIADPITFTTNGSILVTEPPPKGRVKVNNLKIAAADKYAYLFFVQSSDTRPAFQKILDQHHLRYTTKRFPTLPGWDILIVNPEKKIAYNDPIVDSFLHRTIYGGC